MAIKNNLCKDSGRTWRLFREITEGLLYIHEKDIIHGDLRPDNIFLSNTDHAKIGDFGLANTSFSVLQRNLHSGNSTRNKNILSTGAETSEKADMESLGIVLFEMNHPEFKSEKERRKQLDIILKSYESNTKIDEIIKRLCNDNPLSSEDLYDEYMQGD